jgi:hypothetical protein
MAISGRLAVRSGRFLVVFLVMWGLCTSVIAADAVFTDGEFSGWTYDNLAESGQSSEGSRISTGGSPGAALRAVNHISGGESWLYALDDDGSWNPASDGTIQEVQFSVDVIGVQGGGQGMGIHVVAWQDGKYYAAPTSVKVTGYSGSWRTLSLPAYGAADFAFVTECTTEAWDTTDNPDFSATGSPIEFGFMVGNQSSYSHDFISHYDNYQLGITVPEPATMILLAFGGAGLLARKRNRA